MLGGLTVEEALRELPGQEVFAVEASRPCGVALQDMARAGRDSCPVVWPGGKFRWGLGAGVVEVHEHDRWGLWVWRLHEHDMT